MKKFPREIKVYVGDRLEDGTPVWCVAQNVEEIPEDAEEKVGVYVLNQMYKFRVWRELE